MEIITGPITLARLREIAEGKFGEMVKAVVDVDRASWPSTASFTRMKKSYS